MKWSIESFTPSDGSKSAGTVVDHQAWIRGDDRGGAREPVFVHIAMSARDVPEAQARRYLDAMVVGLDAMEAMPR